MSRENVEVVRRISHAWNEGETATLVEFFDEPAELQLNVMMGPYRGLGGIRQFVADLRADCNQLLMTVEETIDSGYRVMASRQRGSTESHHDAPV